MFWIGILGGVAKRSISLSVLCPLTHTRTRSQLNWSFGVVLMWLCTFWEFLLKSHPRVQKWTLDIGKRQYHNQLQLRLVKKLQWGAAWCSVSNWVSLPPNSGLKTYFSLFEFLVFCRDCRDVGSQKTLKTLKHWKTKWMNRADKERTEWAQVRLWLWWKRTPGDKRAGARTFSADFLLAKLGKLDLTDKTHTFIETPPAKK